MDTNKLNRAAQFMPFEALNGLGEELRKREEEHTRIKKREIEEEDKKEISDMLSKIQKGDMLSVIFYFNGHYFTLEGKLNEIDHIKSYIIVEEAQIDFENIYRLKFFDGQTNSAVNSTDNQI